MAEFKTITVHTTSLKGCRLINPHTHTHTPEAWYAQFIYGMKLALNQAYPTFNQFIKLFVFALRKRSLSTFQILRQTLHRGIILAVACSHSVLGEDRWHDGSVPCLRAYSLTFTFNKLSVSCTDRS